MASTEADVFDRLGRGLERARRVDRRSLPDDEAHQGARDRVLRVEELQLLVRLRRHRDGRARAAARHGHLPHDELQAGFGGCVRLGRVHHARRRLGMAHPLSAFDGRVGVLHRRLPAHVPRAALRLVQEAARARLDHRHVHLPEPDGRGVLRLSAAVGQHVVLGRAGHRVAVRRRAVDRQRARRVDSRRLLHLRHHAEPLLRVPRDRRAADARAARRGPHHGVARGRVEQSRRHRDQGAQGPGRQADRRRRVPPVSHEQGFGDHHHLLDPVLGRRVLRARHGRLLPRARELRAGRSAAHARAHRARVVLHAVLRDLARRPEQAARRRADGPRR